MDNGKSTLFSVYLPLGILFVFGFLCSIVFGLILSVFLAFIRIDPWFVLTTLGVFLLWQIVPSALILAIWRRVSGSQEDEGHPEIQLERSPPYGTALLLGITVGFMFQIIKFGAL